MRFISTKRRACQSNTRLFISAETRGAIAIVAVEESQVGRRVGQERLGRDETGDYGARVRPVGYIAEGDPRAPDLRCHRLRAPLSVHVSSPRRTQLPGCGLRAFFIARSLGGQHRASRRAGRTGRSSRPSRARHPSSAPSQSLRSLVSWNSAPGSSATVRPHQAGTALPVGASPAGPPLPGWVRAGPQGLAQGSRAEVRARLADCSLELRAADVSYTGDLDRPVWIGSRPRSRDERDRVLGMGVEDPAAVVDQEVEPPDRRVARTTICESRQSPSRGRRSEGSTTPSAPPSRSRSSYRWQKNL